MAGKTILSLFSGGILLVSCTTDPVNPNKGLLMGATWKLTAETAVPGVHFGNDVITNTYADARFYAACDKDNTGKFTPDGKFTEDEGATKCAAGDPQTATSDWSLNRDQTFLSITDADTTTVWTIDSLTATTLKMHANLSFDDGSHTITDTYVAR